MGALSYDALLSCRSDTESTYCLSDHGGIITLVEQMVLIPLILSVTCSVYSNFHFYIGLSFSNLELNPYSASEFSDVICACQVGVNGRLNSWLDTGSL